MYFHTDTILFRSENISKIRRDLLKDSFNDNLITYSFMQFGPMYYLDAEMAAYRQNDSGIWAGEKKMVSVIREIILYDLECKINPAMKSINRGRHFRNFVFIHDNMDKIKDLDAYYEIAEKYDLPMTKKVLTKQPMFTKKHELDKIVLGYLKFQNIVMKIKRKLS